ncbi:DUF1080 domain-containing protein [Tamlana fucoidanivorans]|uniref:DUF1080 domain-containing protein n=1 Tax=Allotamlana fucoidanivorans TaxID=2583814 RepID=A0A5C4SPQ1_9FLAO|nr:DUF1080 domain-containing protein [Tamlana fucoidanivorans]TNJ46238.1 DUF1080 domain-containing protein [Tamlana fucoidanivorans]
MITRCKQLIPILFIALIISCKQHKKAEIPISKSESWVKLFNGKDLNDWIVKIKGHPVGENYNNTFIAENGVLKVNYKSYKDTFNNAFGHIYYKKPFSNYRFRMKYRFTGKQLSDGAAWANRNSGIMIHCENPKNIGLEQNFPVSIEVQLLGGNGVDERSTANLCTPGTHVEMQGALQTEHCISSSSKTYHGEQWISVEIEVRKDSIIKHYINDELVLQYYKPQYGGKVDYNEDFWKAKEGQPVTGGYISLQSESHPVEFKDIEILEL